MLFTLRRAAIAAMFCLMVSAGSSVRLLASDHADPMRLNDPDANITDLFFFPKGDQYVVILDVHRALTANGPYDLQPYEYSINFDWRTGVTFDDPSQTARYGGKIENPGQIREDGWIKIQMNNDATLKSKQFQGLMNTDQIRVYTGVREDPFDFPRFFKKNAIAMVISIPMSSFPPDRTHFLIWATAFKGGTQIDHVGRSNRTQQARFDELNTLHPSQHVDAIMKHMETWDGRLRLVNRFRETQPLADVIKILELTRKYDLVPDVMIYAKDSPLPGFPNGRLLTDDVAAQTCAVGDCILQELSFIDGGWPRALLNDKPFLNDFPYLAEPYKEGEWTPTPPAAPRLMPWIITLGIILLVVGLLVLWYVAKAVAFYRRHQRELREAV